MEMKGTRTDTLISGKKILCSAHNGEGHTIPVLNLAEKLHLRNDLLMVSRSDRTCRLASRQGIRCIQRFISADGTYDPFLDLSILQSKVPNITVVDYDLIMWILLMAWQPECRVSILRSELLISYQRRNTFLQDKFGFEDGSATRKYNAILSKHGWPQVTDARELFIGDVVIIPSVPQLEPVPEGARERYPNTDWVHTGPLLLPTHLSIDEALQDWLENVRRRGAPIVLVTLGTVWGEGFYEPLADCFADSEFAVLMIVPQGTTRRKLMPNSNRMFRVIGHTDLAELAKRVDLLIHHCGHGTLQTAILAGKPSLTLPSGEYDREDNALRMQDIGCGRHLGHDFFRRGLRKSKIVKAASQLIRSVGVGTNLRQMSTVLRNFVDGRGYDAFEAALARRLHKISGTFRTAR